jgi:hypothetical protein
MAHYRFHWLAKTDLCCCTILSALGIAIGTAGLIHAAATITYVGVIYDQTDLDRLNVGNSGYWFPQFNAANPVAGRPTGENPRDALPLWAGPLNHATSILDPNYATRTFSQDGPARSKGGHPNWNTLTLPNGESGLSGAIVDPHTSGNSNNTINRIQLNAGVPATFYFHVVTDNTSGEHNPTNRLRARGNALGVDIEANTYPQTANLIFNGIADVYTFRYDGFAAGDFIKLQLNGSALDEGASFGGFLFDQEFAPTPVTPGDFNDDGTVDAADYVDWRKRNGPQIEYETWLAHFGQGNFAAGANFASLSIAAVPEPSALFLMLTSGHIVIRAQARNLGRKKKHTPENRVGLQGCTVFSNQICISRDGDGRSHSRSYPAAAGSRSTAPECGQT